VRKQGLMKTAMLEPVRKTKLTVLLEPKPKLRLKQRAGQLKLKLTTNSNGTKTKPNRLMPVLV
jgi:hypothetical protein